MSSGDELAARQPRAIRNALTVLEAVAELGPGATAREISTALGLPRATAYRLLNLLVQDEYLVRTPDLSGFALGAKVVNLARSAAPRWVPSVAREVLTEVRTRIRGGVHLVFYTDGRVEVADEDSDFPLSDPVRLTREPQRYALGRMLLAEQGRLDVADLDHYGVTRQIGEISPEYACLAVPIRTAAGVLAGGLAFSGPRHRVEEPTAVIAVLMPAAQRLTPMLT